MYWLDRNASYYEPFSLKLDSLELPGVDFSLWPVTIKTGESHDNRIAKQNPKPI